MSADGVILFKYMTVDGAIDVLQNRRLRVSLPNQLNDPFEIAPGFSHMPPNVTDDWIESHNTRFADKMSCAYGFFCFSKRNDILLLWSHYAAGHQGVVIGFGCQPNKDLIDVSYAKLRPVIDGAILKEARSREHPTEIVIRSLTTKSDCWGYEQEVRCLVELDKCTYYNGHYYQSIESNLGFIHRVILGCKCPEDEMTFRRIAKQSGFPDLDVVRARRSPTHYALDIPEPA